MLPGSYCVVDRFSLDSQALDCVLARYRRAASVLVWRLLVSL